LVYKAKKSYGGRSGSFGARSGYFKPSWDPMPAYRQPSAPESEYDRKLKNFISRTETRGPETFSPNYHKYHINQQFKNLETGLSKTEVNALIESSLKDAFKNFVEAKGKSQVPDEIFEVALDTAEQVARHFQNNVEQNEVGERSEQPPNLSIDQLNEIRQQQVNEKIQEMDKAKTFEDVGRISADVREINGKFFDQLDCLQNDVGAERAINETNPLLESSGAKPTKVDETPEFVPAIDLLSDDQLEVQKRRRLDYDSEVDAM